MNAFKKMLHKILALILSLFSGLFDGISDGIDDEDIGEIAKNVTLLCLVSGLVLAFGYILVTLALRNSVKLVIIGFLAAGAYSLYQKLTGVPEPETLCKPTAEDYEAGNKTLKPALVKLAPALGLAPIHRYDDIRLDPEDRITQHGKIWRMGFGALKKTVGVDLNENQCKRAIQAEVKRVLERENPAGFSEVRFPYGGAFEPIIQIDEVLQDDAYIYILAVIASNAYFRQRRDRNNQDEVRPTPQDPLFK